MNRITILKTIDKKKHMRNMQYEEFGAYSLLTVKNSKWCIKKALKKCETDNIVISNSSIREFSLQEWIKPYNELSTEIVLEVIEKICREVVLKHSLKLPLEDIYLYASPKSACEFIKKIIGISRIYTIVTEKEIGKEADNLYFEYGYPIRCVKAPDSKNGNDVIAIFIEECGNINSHIINITGDRISGKNVVNLREISVSDMDINNLTTAVSGISGLCLYTMLKKKPSENAIVDINKKADTIFLLDTTEI